MLLLALALIACKEQTNTQVTAPMASEQSTLNQLAERYVKLVLAIGNHQPSYVDAYYGPESFKSNSLVPLEELTQNVSALINDIEHHPQSSDESLRKAFLLVQTRSMLTYIEWLNGNTKTFNNEAALLYDATMPTISIDQLNNALAHLSELVPGEGPLTERFIRYQAQFAIPNDKLDIVFNAAINEARKRTKQHIALDDNEGFNIEYVTDKVWSGYNWYKGNNHSLIQLNTDFPIYIERAIDLASHEGYPGHHVFNSLMEKHLVNNKGWIEYSVYPLFSPMSLLAEGSANYGIDVAFPKQERLAFEQNVLFPLAGFNPTDAPLYYEIQEVKQQLAYADNLVAQQYLDGEIDMQQAIELLMKYTLVTREKALQRIGFIETNRAYVINYTLGQDLVKQYVEKHSNTSQTPWQVFSELLANPKTASMF